MRSVLKRKYDFVCSVGHNCATALYLKRHCLRTTSSPLDWIGAGPNGFATHMGLVCSGFKGLLASPESLIPLPNEQMPGRDDCLHDYYRDSGCGVLCYHDFPKGTVLNQSFLSVRAKYDRRIKRFYERIRQSRRTLLVFQTNCERLDDGVLRATMATVRRHLAPAQVDLLVIENEPQRTEVEIAEPSEGVYRARGWFFRPEKHIVLGDISLCDGVYAQIRLRGQFRCKLRRMLLQRMVRLVSVLHWRARRRHASQHVLARRYLERI